MKKGSARYLRVVAKSIMCWQGLFKQIEKRKLDKREAVVADLTDGFQLYSEIAKAWLMKAIKHPLISMIREDDLDLNFLDNP